VKSRRSIERESCAEEFVSYYIVSYNIIIFKISVFQASDYQRNMDLVIVGLSCLKMYIVLVVIVLLQEEVIFVLTQFSFSESNVCFCYFPNQLIR